uniref:Reverse transcriptase zinc-binding domain-containing protein n=1 Tax=Cannabis sativa TaxID=3483 RepID=A0A803PJM8_CANSA
MYLRLPSIVGRKKNAVLGFLKERMRRRINGWEGRFLSRAGKEILIKIVVQSLPSYAMNVFLFPIGTCNELERMIASFWWKSNNSTSNGSGITWMSWDKMTKCKFDGVFKARYYPQGDYLSTELGWNPSFIWSSIFAARDTVKLGLRKRIGSGTTMQITTDPWLPVIDHSVHVPKVHGLENFTVNSLFQVNNRCWDSDVVKDFFSPEDATIILGIPINQKGGVDSWYWVAEKSGFYSVRSAYNLLQDLKHHSDNSEINVFWKNLWTLKVPPKAKDLVWRAASNCLATKRNLCIKKVLVDSTCPMCGVFAETEWHILVSCDFAWSCLGYAGLAAVGRDSFTSLLSWLDATARRVSSETLDQWVNAQGKGNIPLLSPLKDGDGAEQWIKPSSGIKLNVDAAIFASLLKHGFGCVVRNTDGGLVSAFVGVKNGSVTPELAEIIGIREALSWLKNHAFSRATLETDSLVCVKAIRSEETFSSTFGLVVDDCKNILKNLFNVSILFEAFCESCCALCCPALCFFS